MDDQNKNLILAVVLSGIVMLVWSIWFQPPPPTPDLTLPPESAQTQDGAVVPPAVTGTQTPPPSQSSLTTQSAALDSAPRIEIDTAELGGSITLYGGRLDDLRLKSYRETLDDDSELVTLLSTIGTEHPYYALYGWARDATLAPEDVPSATTIWQLETGKSLTIDTPITLRWDNGKGLIFRRSFAIDDHFMFTITQSIENAGTTTHRAQPYGIIARHGEPELIGFFILHEGVVQRSDGKLNEIDYDKMPKLDSINGEVGRVEKLDVSKAGWVGFTGKDWMTTLIPDGGFTSVVKYDPHNDIYQTEARMPTQDILPGTTITVKSRLFAGPKEWDTIRNYQNKEDVEGLIESIDWGLFSFLTKPIFWLLHTIFNYIGNMGWSIIALTVIIKAALLPLAYKSYVSMAKMKTLQPEMEALKERCGEDKQRMQKEMMALYKKEKVNPAAGCLPILLQIPIFFSLYKVIFISLDLRQAPWIGWIRDLYEPDPSSILNLFGLLPFAAPDAGTMLAYISLGILPILLGISMWLQQKLNPTPTDPTQQMIFAWMPWVFMFMLGNFASGLVLYWITNNTITFIQQYSIMRSQGAKPDVFGNIKESLKRKKQDKK